MGLFDEFENLFNQGKQIVEDAIGVEGYKEVTKPLHIEVDAIGAAFETVKDIPKNLVKAGDDVGDIFTGKKGVGTGVVDFVQDATPIGAITKEDSPIQEFAKKYDIKPIEKVGQVVRTAEHDVAKVGDVVGDLGKDVFDFSKFVAENPGLLVAGGVGLLYVLTR